MTNFLKWNIIAALLLAGCLVKAQGKKKDESDFHRLIQCCEVAKTSDEKYEAFKTYLAVHALPTGFIEEATRWETGGLYIQVFGNIGVLCQIGGYKYPPGFVVFIDIKTDNIILIDTEYELGRLSVKTVPYPSRYGGPEALFPQFLFIVKYLSGSGTGYTQYSEKVYTIDRESVQLSFDEPCYEVDAVYSSITVTFEQKNTYVPRNGLYEIYISGFVKIEHEDAPPVEHQLPLEVYAWNTLTRQFDQIAGRENRRGGSISSIYADIGYPDNPDFDVPLELKGNDCWGRILEKGIFNETECQLPKASTVKEGCSTGAVDNVISDEGTKGSISLEDRLVYPGETLDDVARNYGVSKERIMSINEIEEESDVCEGMVLRIPFEKGIIK